MVLMGFRIIPCYRCFCQSLLTDLDKDVRKVHTYQHLGDLVPAGSESLQGEGDALAPPGYSASHRTGNRVAPRHQDSCFLEGEQLLFWMSAALDMAVHSDLSDLSHRR